MADGEVIDSRRNVSSGLCADRRIRRAGRILKRFSSDGHAASTVGRGERLKADRHVVRAGRKLVERHAADGRVVLRGRLNVQERRITDRHVIARTRLTVAGRALHGEIADGEVEGGGRGVLHGVGADRQVRVRGVDRGAGQRVIADRDVAGGRAGDRRQRVVADRDIARACRRQGIGAGAGHGARADGDVVGACGDVETGVIAHGRVRAGGGLVQRLIADRSVVDGGACERGERAVADRDVIARPRHGIGGRALHRQIAECRVVGGGRGVFHSVRTDGGVRSRGVDRGTRQRVVADGDVAGGPAGDRSQRLVADGDITCGRGR